MAINIKKNLIDPKKIPYYLLLTLLTAGASLILGFLSFGGMYALLPLLPLAFATFGLSVAYEGEIYLQNIKGAFKKLFKSNYLENYLAKEYLLKNFPADTDEQDCPQFFKDYAKQLKLLGGFTHKQLNKESKKRKKQIEKTLADMEKWFALQLFSGKNKRHQEQSAYAQALKEWLAQHAQSEWQARLEKRQSLFNFVKVFSLLSTVFMGLGSTYLIVEAFSVIPVIAAIPFAFWPIMIVPMALIAGAAYGMLTYNTITDLINNDTLNKWYNKIRHDLSQGFTVRNVFVATVAVLLVILAITLTVCTAGTWWTVATNARPLFAWMSKMPSFVMGIINPIITGLSAISFNIQNTAESMEMVDAAARSNTNIFHSIYTSIAEGLAHVRATENWLQILNPFRLILKLTITPLRILFFIGHLISIALTSDRMPGVPQILSALVAIISEGFEDAHYFVGHTHEHHHDDHDEDHHEHHEFQGLLEERLGSAAGHNHNVDIPTRLIKTLALPLYALAASWDWLASKINQSMSDEKNTQRRVLTFAQAWNKQRGIQEDENVTLPSDTQYPSREWQVEHTVSLLEKYEKKHLNAVWSGAELANEKKQALRELKTNIQTSASQGNSVKEILSIAKENPVFNRHRLFAIQDNEKSATQTFIEELPERVNAI